MTWHATSRTVVPSADDSTRLIGQERVEWASNGIRDRVERPQSGIAASPFKASKMLLGNACALPKSLLRETSGEACGPKASPELGGPAGIEA